MFTLEIETANAAFETDAPRAIAEMLRVAADILETRVAADVAAFLQMADTNGNRCGAFYYRPEHVNETDTNVCYFCGRSPTMTTAYIRNRSRFLCLEHGREFTAARTRDAENTILKKYGRAIGKGEI